MNSTQTSYKRFAVKWSAKAADPEHGLVNCVLKGLSVTGGYLEYPHPLPIHTELLLEIHPIIKQQMFTVKIKAKILQKTLLSDNRGFGLSLKLVQIASEDKEIIRKAIIELAHQNYKQ